MNDWDSMKELQVLCGWFDFIHIYMMNISWFSLVGLTV